MRSALGDPTLSIDSPPKLLRALHRAEIDVESTSQWELLEHDHPAIEPLLRYKKMSRLLTANGWTWLDEWVDDGRYRPVYVPGGVVTGRWAASGGGALQIPRQLRPALRADEGWRLVSADVSQLEPRVLAPALVTLLCLFPYGAIITIVPDQSRLLGLTGLYKGAFFICYTISTLLVRLVARPGQDSLLSTPPTFGMYEVAAALNDVTLERVPLVTPA